MRKKTSFLQNTVCHLVYDLHYFFFFLEEKILTYISWWEFYQFSLTKDMWRKQKETLMSKKQKGGPANYRLLSLSLVSWEAGVGGGQLSLLPSLWQRHCPVPVPGDPQGHVPTQICAQAKATDVLVRFLLTSLGTMPCGISSPVASSF